MLSTKISKRALVAIVDFLILSISLYLALSLRSLSLLSKLDFLVIFKPFLIIIFINLAVFYIYGLYDRISVKIYQELNQRVLVSQILSSILGATIFYTTNLFIIAPKTILLIYILISSLLIFIWRRSVKNILKSPKTNTLLLVASGVELQELAKEIENNKILNIKSLETINLDNNQNLNLYTEIKNKVQAGNFNMLAINMHHPHIKNSISLFYELLLDGVEVINFADLYEEVLQKIPLENIDAGWFFNNLYNKQNKFYTKVKRALDLILAVPLFLITLIIYPFIALSIKLQDRGPIFYVAERVGRNNQVFKVYKFRSMTNKQEVDVESQEEKLRITRLGKFLRNTRLDELPQLINILRGELSFIGPRPEYPKLVKEYTNQIPFYGIRHTITPGLSGYAQIYQEANSVPKFGISVNSTQAKLAYDIYYLKHRSILMDLSLTLKTIKSLLEKSGL